MANPLDSLAQYIAVDLAVGALGTVVFEDKMPDSVAGTYDTCVAVIPLPGSAPALTWGDDTDSPGFLILSRSLDTDTAIANLTTIQNGIHGLYERDLHGTHFKLIAALGSRMSLGEDERSRMLFSQAYRSMVRGVTR